jgi:transcriptional regulator with XRE-family HTH domain
MPRPVRHRHVLRDLRHAIKRTQSQFAKLLGVSRVYVNKIENGQLPVSVALAIRVHVLTGISIDELTKGSAGKLIDHFGRPYSAETFIWWQKIFRQPTEKDAAARARNLRWWTWILLRGAAIHHKGIAYNAVITALIQSLDTIRREFGLIQTTDRLLSECVPPVKWLPGGHTPGDLSQIERELQKEVERAAEIPARKITWSWSLPRPSKQPSKKKKHRR